MALPLVNFLVTVFFDFDMFLFCLLVCLFCSLRLYIVSEAL